MMEKPPSKVKQIQDNILEITIHIGKNRIIRRIMEKSGYKVTSLERTKIGDLALGNLKPGKYRMLNNQDKEKIFR